MLPARVGVARTDSWPDSGQGADYATAGSIAKWASVRAVVRVAAATVVMVCCAARAAGSALAASRVASPTGTANPTCSSAVPCDLATALTGAHSGDDVFLSAGDYGSVGAPIQGSIQTNAANVTHVASRRQSSLS